MERTIGIVLVVALGAFWLFYLLGNLRRSRAEIGSEVELAPNRKRFYEDETLEGRVLERTQWLGLGMLLVVVIGLPLYWLAEPGRQSGAETYWDAKLAGWGADLFATTEDGGFGCAGCHGAEGIGGVAPYTFSDPATGETRTVAWKAPALNTALIKFSEESIRYILVYGRPFSPMSPWGLEGGGPLNDQQIETLIEYMKSIQITPEEAQADIAEALAEARENPDNAGKSDGELLFNLEAAAGAYGCARCHTKGWSYDDPSVTAGGAYGPNLTGGATVRQFPVQSDHEEFIRVGPVEGKRYGVQGQGNCCMPGFGQIYTDEQIRAVVEYERTL